MTRAYNATPSSTPLASGLVDDIHPQPSLCCPQFGFEAFVSTKGSPFTLSIVQVKKVYTSLVCIKIAWTCNGVISKERERRGEVSE